MTAIDCARPGCPNTFPPNPSNPNKRYCSRTCQTRATSAARIPIVTRICESDGCSNEFQCQSVNLRRFCADQCRRNHKARLATAANRKPTCSECPNPIPKARMAQAKTCSKVCAEARELRRHRERQAAYRQEESELFAAINGTATRSAGTGPLAGCIVCKRLERDGHDSWCSPQRRMDALKPQPIMPSPVRVIEGQPSDFESRPAPVKSGFVLPSEESNRRASASGGNATAAKFLAKEADLAVGRARGTAAQQAARKAAAS